MSDPRAYFASERTLLAWIRTGLTVMGLGFVVAKFGLFLAVISGSGSGPGSPLVHWHSTALGILLVLVGAGAVLGAVQNHRLFVRTLPPGDRPREAIPSLGVLVAFPVAVIGLLLAAYLAIS